MLLKAHSTRPQIRYQSQYVFLPFTEEYFMKDSSKSKNSISSVKYLHTLFRVLKWENNFENGLEFARGFNKFGGSVFPRSDDVQQSFDDLYETLPSMFELLINDFVDTYNRRRRMDGRASPGYLIELWNAYGRTLDDSMRTNE
jgi:hypothetical protein